MRCKPSDGKAWTTVRVRELRERLGIAPFDLTAQHLDERIVPSCLEGIPV